MRAVGRASVVVLVSVLIAMFVGFADWSHTIRDLWWTRFVQADDVADDVLVVTDEPGATNPSWTAATVSSLLTLLAEGGARTVVLSGIQLDIIDDRVGGTGLLAVLEESEVAPTVLNVTSLASGSSLVPPATLSGPPASPAGIGFTVPEQEQSVETTPLLVRDETGGDDIYVASLGMVAAIREEGAPLVAALGDGTLEVGATKIPVEPGQRLRTSYAAELERAGSGHRIWVNDVLFGGIDPQTFEDRTVFVGPSDGRTTRTVEFPAAGGRIPLVFAEANVANTLLTGSFTDPLPGWATLAVVAAVAALVAGAFTRLSWRGASLTAVGVLGLEAVMVEMAGRSGHLIDPAVLIVGTIAATVVASNQAGLRGFTERKRIRSLFEQYVPPTVAKELVDHGPLSQVLAGTRVTATVLFCDIRGFTPLTADLDGPAIRSLLDAYYDELSDVVLELGGSVLSYTGDEILAAFGVPLNAPDHARRAIDCAVAMQSRRDQLGDRLREEGLPVLDYGIGIQTGPVVSTVVGSRARQQYAVIGLALTLGSRLCGQAGAGEVVVSEDTWAASGRDAPDATVEWLRVKGLDDQLQVHRISNRERA